MIAQLGRFGGIGILATLVHVVVALAAQTLLNLAPQTANLFGFLSSVLVSYFGHSKYTFQVATKHRTHAPRFVALALLALAVSSSTTHIAVSVLDVSFGAAMGLVAILVPLATFFGSKYWAFAEINARPKVVWSGVALSIGLALAFLTVMWGRTINHDTAWYLYATREWLDGARLYVDIVEVNPPLNFYMTVPAILLADLLDISDTNAQYLFFSVVLAASLLWIWTLLGRQSALSGRMQLIVLLGSALALVIPAGPDIAQREHLMLVLIMPYVFGFLLVPKPDSGGGAFARTLVAAVGLCVKPFFMLIPIGFTLVRIVQTRSLAPIWSVANFTILLTGLGYLLLAYLLHPEYLDTIVPTARYVYGAYGLSDLAVIYNAGLGIILLFAFLVLYQTRLPAELPKGGILVAAVVAGLAIYAVQWTGYEYQALPIKVFIAFYCIWLLAHTNLWSGHFLVAVVLLGWLGKNAVTTGFYHEKYSEIFAEAVDEIGPQPAVMIFSTSLTPAFPLVVNTGAIWTSRYPALWLLPGALNGVNGEACETLSERCEAIGDILDQTRKDIVTDFLEGAPDLVIFDKRNHYIRQPDFDYKTFLAEDPRFLGQMSQYYLAEQSNRFETWLKRPEG